MSDVVIPEVFAIFEKKVATLVSYDRKTERARWDEAVIDLLKFFESIIARCVETESQLADAQARLAGYEEGFDPATNPPDDSAYVFVKTNDGGQYYAVYDCPSDDSIARFIVLPFEEFTPIFSINNIARWFPLPGAAFGELAKGAE